MGVKVECGFKHNSFHSKAIGAFSEFIIAHISNLLECIPKQRARITHLPKLLLRILSMNLFEQNTVTLRIDAFQTHTQTHRRRRSNKKDCQREAKSEPVLGGLAFEVDVGSYGAAEVTDGDLNRHSDGAFPGAGEVVRCKRTLLAHYSTCILGGGGLARPRHDAYDCGVQSKGDDE